MKAILVLDDIPEEFFAETISIKYELIYYPDGHMKELGRHGKQRLRPMPKKKPLFEAIPSVIYVNGKPVDNFVIGWNECINEILGGTDNE